MANRRMISSEIFLDDWFGNLGNFERILWIGLFTACADDQGRFIFAPAAIRAQVFPYDDIDLDDIREAMDRFIADAKIAIYQPESAKRIYAQIVKWWEYQKPSWAMPSKYPAPVGWMDRAKYHIIPSKVTTLNWDKPGGYAPGSPLPQPLPNTLRSPLPNTLPGGIDELSRDELSREEKGGENPAAAPAYLPPFQEPAPMIVSYADACSQVQPMLSRACNIFAIPADELKRTDQIASLIQYCGLERTEEVIRQKYKEWKNTPRKNGGGRTYSTTNFGFIDWAQDELQKSSDTDFENVDPSTLHGEKFDKWVQQQASKKSQAN